MKKGQAPKGRDPRSFNRFGKVNCLGPAFSIPGSDKQLTIPAFTSEQMLGALKVVNMLGNDFSHAYRLAGFIFEKVTDFNLVEPGVIPSNRIYSEWLLEFRVQIGLITGRFAAMGTA